MSMSTGSGAGGGFSGGGGFGGGGGGGGGVRGPAKTIDEQAIDDARQKMQELAISFGDTKVRINEITTQLLDNWVGKGRTEFATQYDLLIGKVDDIGDSLDDMNDALIEAQAAYQETDQAFHREVSMSLEDAGLIDAPLDHSDGI